MQRYFISKDALRPDGQCVITGDDYHHMVRVMRMNIGDHVSVVLEEKSFLAQLCVIADSEVRLEVKETIATKAEPDLEICLLQGLPKGEKIELVLRQAAEIGVARVIVFGARRSVAVMKPDKMESRLARWMKIAKESAELAQRERIPVVEYANSLEDALRLVTQSSLLLVPYERQDLKVRSLKEWIRHRVRPEMVSFVIGPEGGFAEEEVVLMENAGGKLLTLGPRILRTETAGIVVASVLLYEWDQMGVS